MTTDSDVAEVLRLERELQTAECRRDHARVSALRADDFVEVGASGRVWIWPRPWNSSAPSPGPTPSSRSMASPAESSAPASSWPAGIQFGADSGRGARPCGDATLRAGRSGITRARRSPNPH